MKKLSVLLALKNEAQKVFKNGIQNYTDFFQRNQGAFKGIRKTYEPFEGTTDDPSKRDFSLVVTTVAEKISYLPKVFENYINNAFSVERTNSSGTVKAELIVDGISWGEFSSLELLALKSLVENAELKKMYSILPTRAETKIWKISEDTEFASSRDIYQTDVVTSIIKTTESEDYILEDPNVTSGKVTNYHPQKSVRKTIKELGRSTSQEFSGETRHSVRAEVLRRIDAIKIGVIEALEKANQAEPIQSELTYEKIFGFIHAPILDKK